jgi:glycosyltransferase involved in cell wall biosynthesis
MRLLMFNLAMDLDDPPRQFIVHWVKALSEYVEQIHVITMRAGRVEVPDNVRVYSVGKEKSYSEPRRALEFYRHLFRILREDKIDVCFSHMIPIFTVLGAPVLKFRGIPIVTWYAHPSLTWVLKLAHHLSNRMISSIATAYPYKHDKLTVTGQGIDTNLFSPNVKVSTEEPALILCVGRLSPIKDHPTLLKAAWLLRQRWGKPFRVLVIGSPTGPRDESYVRSLHGQVKELELEDSISFEPSVPMAELPSWYRRCTLHVNLTPIGFGDKVILEALACGRPCLMANEGFKETLGKYIQHLLFRHGDPEDLARKLERILNMSPMERDEIGYCLREHVIQQHSLRRLAKRLVGLFTEECLG